MHMATVSFKLKVDLLYLFACWSWVSQRPHIEYRLAFRATPKRRACGSNRGLS